MLVLTRKAQEVVVVGAPDTSEPLLTITVLDIVGGTVRLGFQADASVPVHRWEVWQRIQAGSLPPGRAARRGLTAEPNHESSSRRKGRCLLNRPPWDVRHAAPSHAPGAAPRGGPDETLVVDARAGLTPADMVERVLQYRLRGGVVSASHVRMGAAQRRGRAAETPRAPSPAPPPPSLQEPLMQVVRPGDRVRVHYVKCFQDGSVVSSRGKAPAEVTVGLVHPRLPGLGLALVGLAVGESRTLVVPARRAYGAYDPARVYRLARTRFAAGQALHAGTWVQVPSGGRRRRVRVVEVRTNTVIVDANRRWAGQSLVLEVTVIAIRGPEAPPCASQGAEAHTRAPERDHNDDRWRDDGGQN